MTLVPLDRLRGHIAYRSRGSGEEWGFEDWSMTRGRDGIRVMAAHCEMAFWDDRVVRDSVISIQADYHPRDAYVRIMRDGELTGTGWFLFSDDEATCESWTRDEGRISQRLPIKRPIRGFGVHAVQGDGWLACTFPWDKGAGHTQFFGRNLLHSTHHFGATGPFIVTTGSGLTYIGDESVEVPAGRFDCYRVRFVGLTNDHPTYDMWLTRDGNFVYVKGVVEGYMDSEFVLTSLEGEMAA